MVVVRDRVWCETDTVGRKKGVSTPCPPGYKGGAWGRCRGDCVWDRVFAGSLAEIRGFRETQIPMVMSQ